MAYLFNDYIVTDVDDWMSRMQSRNIRLCKFPNF